VQPENRLLGERVQCPKQSAVFRTQQQFCGRRDADKERTVNRRVM